jgi:hypothetical protein
MSVMTTSDTEAFDRDGFVIKRGFFASEEIGAVINAFQVDQSIHKRAYGVDDGQGGWFVRSRVCSAARSTTTTPRSP